MIDYTSLPIKEQIKLLELEIGKIKHEIAISKLVYSNHGEDTYDDLFRDNIPVLEDKIYGIRMAINNLMEESD
jgi:predicted site-specific integrase-resolvase